MKVIVPICLGLGLLLTGCGDKSDKPAPNAAASTNSGSLVTAPVDYLKSAADAKHSAVNTIDVTSLNKALQLFNVDQGRYPKDLNELVEKKYIPKVPEPAYGTRLVYDVISGSVKVENE